MLKSDFSLPSTNTRVKLWTCKTSDLKQLKQLAMTIKPVAYLFNSHITQKSIITTKCLKLSTQVLWQPVLRVITTIVTFATITRPPNDNKITVHIFLSCRRMCAVFNNKLFKRIYFFVKTSCPRRFNLKTKVRPIGNQAIVIAQHRQDGLINNPNIRLIHCYFPKSSIYLLDRVNPSFQYR